MEEKNSAKAKEPAPTARRHSMKLNNGEKQSSAWRREVWIQSLRWRFFYRRKRIQGQKLLKYYSVYAASLNNAKLNLILKSWSPNCTASLWPLKLHVKKTYTRPVLPTLWASPTWTVSPVLMAVPAGGVSGDTLLSPSYVAYNATGTDDTLLSPPLPPMAMAGSPLPPVAMADSTQ